MNINKEINALINTIYNGISQTIKVEKYANHLKYSSISADNEKMLINIANKHINKRRNPYLLPKPKKADDPKSLTNIIVKKLGFKSSYELVWQNEEENDLLKEVYRIGINYLLQKDKTKKQAELFLCNDYEYAKSLSKFNHMKDLSINEQIDKYQEKEWKIDEAIYLLSFNLIKSELIEAHQNYFFNLVTSKLDKNLIKFFNKDLLKIISEYNKNHNSSHILATMDDIYNLVSNPNANLPKNASEDQKNQYSKNTKKLFNKGEEYIDLLIKRQNLTISMSNK